MPARVTTVHVPPERMDEAVRVWRERFLARLGALRGLRDAYLLFDSADGTAMSVTLWDPGKDLDADEQSLREILAAFAQYFEGQPWERVFEVRGHVRTA